MIVSGIDVVIPGGLVINGSVERRVRFLPLTGKIEQSLIEFEFEKDLNRPGYVTAVLTTVIDTIGNRSMNTERVADLCVADRQYLMLRLAALLDGDQMWLQVACTHCDSLFDVEVRRCDLPVKQAGQYFPVVTLRINEWEIDVRVPTGADQQNIGNCSEEQAMQRLLQNCILSVNGSPPGRDFIKNLSESDINMIDQALDEASPAVCSQLRVTCPECGWEQHVELDHYSLPGINEHYFYDEVHTLASHYHWSEQAILDLPQAKRRMYLGLINRSAGIMTGQE
jgi:hypothetical protein